MLVLEYLEPDYKYAVIFTDLDKKKNLTARRKNLSLEKEGSTCCWKISPKRKIEKIILYVREYGINKVYRGDYFCREKAEKDRVKIFFKNLENIRSTDSNWVDFVDSRSPVRYLIKT